MRTHITFFDEFIERPTICEGVASEDSESYATCCQLSPLGMTRFAEHNDLAGRWGRGGGRGGDGGPGKCTNQQKTAHVRAQDSSTI